jgi:hypothetical protein
MTGILVYCSDYQCGYSVSMNADRWGEKVRLSDIEYRFVCRHRGADVRPLAIPEMVTSHSLSWLALARPGAPSSLYRQRPCWRQPGKRPQLSMKIYRIFAPYWLKKLRAARFED